jgi:hypothetical protein
MSSAAFGARLIFEVLVWSARTGVDQRACHAFLLKFHHGGGGFGGFGGTVVDAELRLLSAFDYALMERCGVNRLDEIQLSMLLACVLRERELALLAPCSEARVARFVATIEVLWCERRCGQALAHLAEDRALYLRWRAHLD